MTVVLAATFVLTKIWKESVIKAAKKDNTHIPQIPTRIIRVVAVLLWITIVFASTAGGLIERNDLGWITIVQYPNGIVRVQTEPGYLVQLFGEVWKYPKASTCFFSADKREGSPTDESIPVNFNDGGSAKFSGSLVWNMPLARESIKLIHTKFRSAKNAELSIIMQLAKESLGISGVLVNSVESYTGGKGKFSNEFQDQLINGLYVTEPYTITEEYEEVGRDGKAFKKTKERRLQRVKLNTHEQPLRRRNTLTEYGITISQANITEIIYEKKTQEFIDSRRKQLQEIEVARADAERARYQAIAAAEQGKKEVTEKKYAQLKIKEQKVIEAEQNRDVIILEAEAKREQARRDAEAAQFEKEAAILRSEGRKQAAILEAEGRTALLKADNALDKKLAFLQEVLPAMAREWSQRPVPTFVIGESSSGTGSSTELAKTMELLNTHLVTSVAEKFGVDFNMVKTNK